MEVKDGGEAKEIRIPATANNGLILIKLKLATTNVKLQTILAELQRKKHETKSDLEFLITWLDNLKVTTASIIDTLPRKTKRNADFKRLISSYTIGINSVQGKLNEMK